MKTVLRRSLPSLLTLLSLAAVLPAGAQNGPTPLPVTATVRLAWNKQPEEEHLAGYRVHYGFESGLYVVTLDCAQADQEGDFEILPADGSDPDLTLGGLECGKTHFMAVTAYDTFGLESDYSNEISFTTPTRPGVPGTLRVLEMSVSSDLTSWAPAHYQAVACAGPRQFFQVELR